MTKDAELFREYVPPDLHQKALEGAEDPERNPENLTPLEWAKKHLLRTREEFVAICGD